MIRKKDARTLVCTILLITLPAIVYGQGGSGELPATKTDPASKPKTATPRPAAPAKTTITYNEELTARLDARSSDQIARGHYFEQYTMEAKSEDLLSIKLESENQGLVLQIFDNQNVEIPVAKDANTGVYSIKTQNGGLPADGEYKIRVSGRISGRGAVPFNLKVDRLGILHNLYSERFQKIIINFRETDPASVDETLSKLEELTSVDNHKPGAFEFLGIIYLYNKSDYAKAEEAMGNAIKANGAAVIKISHDRQWRRMSRAKNGEFQWQEPMTGWLRIRPDELKITDYSNKSLAVITGKKVLELSKILTATNNLISVTADGERRPYIFLPGSKSEAEADLVIKLIHSHVMGKTN